MSTPLVTALRESCGYLRDGGYHQTAQLMALAADEIERLNRQLQALEAAQREPGSRARRPLAPPPESRESRQAGGSHRWNTHFSDQLTILVPAPTVLDGA